MTLPRRLSAVSLVMVAALAGCGDDEASDKAGPPAEPVSAPCLVTAAQLDEITGTSQEIQEVDVPEGMGADLTCETVVDERDVSLKWSLREPFIDPPPTHEEQRSLVEEDDMVVEEADLGSGLSGWVGAGRVFDHSEARVVTLLGDRMLHVEVNADDDAAVSVSQIKDDALALARAVVAAQADRIE